MAACSSRNPLPVAPTADVTPKNTMRVQRPIPAPKVKKSRRSGLKNQVFWRLINRDQITLNVQSLGPKPRTITLKMTEENFYHFLPSGDWQIQSFIIEGKNYSSMNSAQNPGFKVFKNSFSYAGALIIDCPKVGQEFFDDLKLMKFFNRYTFSSKDSLCELIVGNDFDLVKDAWVSPKNSKTPKLLLGL